MDSKEIRQKFLDFFAKRGHKIVPSVSLIPDDPSVLLTTAGMQQFKKYFTGELDAKKDFGSLNTVSIQKCFRTSDIDEVGDDSHLTFFEMLGNFSFGGYWKKEAIEYAHEFITKEMDLKIDYVSVFSGDGEVPADKESEKVWRDLGISEIKKCGREDNFWGPTGSEGPCGPTTEIYVNGIEIWNLVFNEYYSKDGKLTPLKTKGVDTGMGLERLAMVSQNVPTIFETDLFEPLMDAIEPHYDIRIKRILIDHIRAVVYLIVDGIEPSNKDRGYILRRLLRKIAINIGKEAIIPLNQREQPIKSWNEKTYEVIKFLKDILIKLDKNLQSEDKVINLTIRKETDKFIDLLKSEKEVEEVIKKYKNSKDRKIPGIIAFNLHSSLGISIDYIKDEIKKDRLTIDEEGFEEEKKKHQEISRAGAEKKFGGHGLILNTGELKAGNEEELKKVTRLHTATHLLHQALREVLGDSVGQKGSDITPERTRFDFSFPRKLTPEEIQKIEDLVNQKIKEDLPVSFKEMPKNEAEKTGALYFSREKYPEIVKVYFVGHLLEDAWSKEFCGGPHVGRTSEIGEFKILKEEAVAAGVRRIRAAIME